MRKIINNIIIAVIGFIDNEENRLTLLAFLLAVMLIACATVLCTRGAYFKASILAVGAFIEIIVPIVYHLSKTK